MWEGLVQWKHWFSKVLSSCSYVFDERKSSRYVCYFHGTRIYDHITELSSLPYAKVSDETCDYFIVPAARLPRTLQIPYDGPMRMEYTLKILPILLNAITLVDIFLKADADHILLRWRNGSASDFYLAVYCRDLEAVGSSPTRSAIF